MQTIPLLNLGDNGIRLLLCLFQLVLQLLLALALHLLLTALFLAGGGISGLDGLLVGFKSEVSLDLCAQIFIVVEIAYFGSECSVNVSLFIGFFCDSGNEVYQQPGCVAALFRLSQSCQFPYAFHINASPAPTFEDITLQCFKIECDAFCFCLFYKLCAYHAAVHPASVLACHHGLFVFFPFLIGETLLHDFCQCVVMSCKIVNSFNLDAQVI